MKYTIGIDLGTSNSVVALSRGDAPPQVVSITQLMDAGVVADRPLLPSVLYLPYDGEFAHDALALPWVAPEREIVGLLARERGSTTPERAVTSAKSWLSTPHVDRLAEILPWQSTIAERKVSPYEATRRYLAHLRQALAHAVPDLSFADCSTVITLPASFDDTARSLTYEAARAAGWEEFSLLEEPQAAFYAWLSKEAASWREQIKAGDIVLVCDVGGGTSDFSLIGVTEEGGTLKLERLAVGEHILLGGDNMDLALAHVVRTELADNGQELDHWQFLGLVHQARAAKERLLSDSSIDEVPVAIAGRSARLFAGTISTAITRRHVQSVVLEGFIPLTSPDEMPLGRRATALREAGLPYAVDAALSKHLARFLSRSAPVVAAHKGFAQAVSPDGNFVRPTALLFNGGVFKADAIRTRVRELLARWSGDPLRELSGESLDLAVALGAAYFARLTRDGDSLRIRAGIPRSYYLGIESAELAVPGYNPPLKGICVVPQGTEEGSTFELGEREFALVTGEPVEFRFFSSTARPDDDIGTVLERAEQTLDELSPLSVTLPTPPGQPAQLVPVRLTARVNDVGILELWMNHTRSDERWKLEFNVRGEQ